MRLDADAAVEHVKPVPSEAIPARRNRPVEPVAPADRETVDPEREAAERIDHQVHRKRVRRILGPAETRFDAGETSLHEHDQEARSPGSTPC